MNKKQEKITRRMYSWEIYEAKRVFGNRIIYEQVRIHECVDWLFWVNHLNVMLKRTQEGIIPNAITLGNHCYFPIQLPSFQISSDDSDHYKISWLIHELTHVWQYQRMGWKYLFFALRTQITSGKTGYEFGGEEGLEKFFLTGATFFEFNLEQQGDIARSYYERISHGKDVRAWTPFINEIQQEDRINLV